MYHLIKKIFCLLLALGFASTAAANYNSDNRKMTEQERAEYYSDLKSFIGETNKIVKNDMENRIPDADNLKASRPFHSRTLLVWTNNLSLPSFGAIMEVRNTKYYSMFQYNTVEEAQSALEQLQERSDVEYAVFNEWIYSDPMDPAVPPSSLRASYTGQNESVKPAINYDAYMNSTTGSLSDEVVAVIDSGFGSTDPIFDGRIVGGYDVADNDNTLSNPGYQHGTNVASMIALFSRTNVKIMPIKTFKDNTSSASTADINNSIYYAISQGVNVINLSLGGYVNNWYSPATDAAYNANIICVAAAGNDSIDAISVTPAAYSSVITVGANDSFTSGYPKWTNTNYGDLVDTYAPAYDLLCANEGGADNWSWYAGTSLSSPIVAGGIADILGYQKTRGAYLNAENANVFVRLSNNGDNFDLYALNNMRMSSVLPFSGSGTANNPYIINTYSQLQTLSKMNYLGYQSEGIYYRLGADISLGNDWVPIGYKSSGTAQYSNGTTYVGEGTVFPFKGYFDGNGHTITMSYTPISYPGSTYNIDYSGVFGYVMNGSVSNLNVRINGNITTPSATQYTGACFGAIVGKLENSSLNNCTVSGGTVTAGTNHTVVGSLFGISIGSTITYPTAIPTLTPNKVEIFPTLAKDKLYIKTNCNLSAYKIYNSQGKVCLAGVLQDNTVDVSTLYPGVYYIVSYKDKTAVNTNTFIKH